jgi:hypothetical protein
MPVDWEARHDLDNGGREGRPISEMFVRVTGMFGSKKQKSLVFSHLLSDSIKLFDRVLTCFFLQSLFFA